jgi:nucleotide-binding universal stress UspA family protein
MFQPRTILHPTDFSACSAHALAIARDLAQQHGARLLLLYVAETLGPENVTYGEAISQREPQAYHRRLQEYLKSQLPQAGADIRVEAILAGGDPAPEIERVARERHCDLIVMGTHGYSGLHRLLMGSVAEHVVRQAPCPVLTVKLPAEQPSRGA